MNTQPTLDNETTVTTRSLTALVWDTYFQKRINTALFLAGGALHDENALKVRTRLILSLAF